MAYNLTIPTVTLSSYGELTLYRPQTSLSQEMIDACIAGALSSMKLEFDTANDACTTFIAMLCLAFPEFIEHYEKCESVKVKTELMSPDNVCSAFGAGNIVQEDAPKRLPLSSPVDANSLGVATTRSVFCGLAVMAFALGKSVDKTAPSPFTDKRPKSLIEKYKLSESELNFFPGKMFGPTINVLDQVAYSFVEMPEVKSMTAALLLSQLSKRHAPLPMDCILTAFKLLKGSQLAHAQAIGECCAANPWIVNIPELRPGLQNYARDLVKLNELPSDARWFIKLLYNDNNPIFNRQDMKALAAVAVDWKKKVEPTFVAYKGDDTGYAAVIQQFQSYMVTKTMGVLTGDSLANQLGLPQAALPEQTARTQARSNVV